MAYIQIIEYKTSQPEAMEAAAQEWYVATEGKRKARRRILCQDRDDPNRYLSLVFFDSYDDAMQNSAMPETGALAQKMSGMAEGPATFHNLDVKDDRT